MPGDHQFFETELLQNYLNPIRVSLGIRGNRRRSRQTRQKFRARTGNVWADSFVEMSTLPANFAFRTFHGRPGLVEGKEMPDDASLATNMLSIHFLHTNWPARARALAGIPAALIPSSLLMSRYVTKICHAAAVAEGWNFIPITTEVIRLGDLRGAAHFIGGRNTDRLPSDTLHQIRFTPMDDLLLVGVQLFAPFVGYEFEVVVGVLLK